MDGSPVIAHAEKGRRSRRARPSRALWCGTRIGGELLPTLSKSELFERVLDAVRRGSSRVEVVTGTPPFGIRVHMGARTELLRIYIWNITPGGRDLEGEQRIQVTGEPPARPPDGDAIMLGWHEAAGVFVGFDFDHHAGAGSSASVQVQMQTLERAAQDGIALQRKGPTEVAAAFRPENLVGYLQHRHDIHQVGYIPNPALALGVAEDETGESPDLDPPERQRVTAVVSRLLRDASFRTRVLEAYDHACCACGLQLGLIEAAHIIPVGEPGSTDETSNGLALCVLHHRAYDASLLAIRENGSIDVNEEAIASLRERGLDGGEAQFRGGLFEQILLPPTDEDRPLAENLQRGRRLRGN